MTQIIDPSKKLGFREVYEVPIATALGALKAADESAWWWYIKAPIKTRIFLFPVESCKENK